VKKTMLKGQSHEEVFEIIPLNFKNQRGVGSIFQSDHRKIFIVRMSL
jgi:hypothetical protein